MINYINSGRIFTTLLYYSIKFNIFNSLSIVGTGSCIYCNTNSKFFIESCYFVGCYSSETSNIYLYNCNSIILNCSIFLNCSALYRYATFNCQSLSTNISDTSIFHCKCILEWDVSYGNGYSSFLKMNYSYNTCPMKGTSAIVTRGNSNKIIFGQFINSKSANELVVAFENCYIFLSLSNFINHSNTVHYGGTIWIYYSTSILSDLIVYNTTSQYSVFITSSTTTFSNCYFEKYSGSISGIITTSNFMTILQPLMNCLTYFTKNKFKISIFSNFLLIYLLF